MPGVQRGPVGGMMPLVTPTPTPPAVDGAGLPLAEHVVALVPQQDGFLIAAELALAGALANRDRQGDA